jgi:hypothetical protein
MIEVALRQRDTNREWLAPFDECIRRDSVLDVDNIRFRSLNRNLGFDKRILYLPV